MYGDSVKHLRPKARNYSIYLRFLEPKGRLRCHHASSPYGIDLWPFPSRSLHSYTDGSPWFRVSTRPHRHEEELRGSRNLFDLSFSGLQRLVIGYLTCRL